MGGVRDTHTVLRSGAFMLVACDTVVEEQVGCELDLDVSSCGVLISEGMVSWGVFRGRVKWE